MDNLKPCPFCGGEAEIRHVGQDDYGDGLYAICCKGNRHPCPITLMTIPFDTDDASCNNGQRAIAAWNTRPGEDAARRKGAERVAREAAAQVFKCMDAIDPSNISDPISTENYYYTTDAIEEQIIEAIAIAAAQEAGK